MKHFALATVVGTKSVIKIPLKDMTEELSQNQKLYSEPLIGYVTICAVFDQNMVCVGWANTGLHAAEISRLVASIQLKI